VDEIHTSLSQILRVAARNKAAYEWIHHEPVGRSHGLTTLQLLIIRDISGWRTSRLDVLKPLQSAALAFTDASTIEVQVPDPVFDALRGELENLVREGKANTTVDDLLVECAAVVSTYNMVSRFLVSLDVAGTSNDIVPFPFDRDGVSVSPTFESGTLLTRIFAAHHSQPLRQPSRRYDQNGPFKPMDSVLQLSSHKPLHVVSYRTNFLARIL
jgi:hypothetical protein